MVPPHPAYTGPSTPASLVRQSFAAAADPSYKIGDVGRAVKRIYEIAEHPNPPLRVVLGDDAIELVRAQLELVRKDVDGSVAWSHGLKED